MFLCVLVRAQATSICLSLKQASNLHQRVVWDRSSPLLFSSRRRCLLSFFFLWLSSCGSLHLLSFSGCWWNHEPTNKAPKTPPKSSLNAEEKTANSTHRCWEATCGCADRNKQRSHESPSEKIAAKQAKHRTARHRCLRSSPFSSSGPRTRPSGDPSEIRPTSHPHTDTDCC